MNNYIRIAIALQSPEQAGILVAQLSEAGYEGFEEDENKFGIYHVYAFIPEEAFRVQALTDILSMHALAFSKQVIEQKNWNEEWENNFQPVVVGDFCAIRASFHKTVDGVKNEIIITPKMSFGTGHHATTYLMVEAMEHINFTGRSVFDFGTGTGVLSILAEKLGAANIPSRLILMIGVSTMPGKIYFLITAGPLLSKKKNLLLLTQNLTSSWRISIKT